MDSEDASISPVSNLKANSCVNMFDFSKPLAQQRQRRVTLINTEQSAIDKSHHHYASDSSSDQCTIIDVDTSLLHPPLSSSSFAVSTQHAGRNQKTLSDENTMYNGRDEVLAQGYSASCKPLQRLNGNTMSVMANVGSGGCQLVLPHQASATVAKSSQRLHIITREQSQSKTTQLYDRKVRENTISLANQPITPCDDQKQFQCFYCIKRFSRANNMQAHMKIHTGKISKQFPCEQCGKRFARRSGLSRHLRIHTGEKPLVCTECHKRFADSSNLARHLRLHSGERPFKCAQCNKRFAWKSSLVWHQRSHIGVENTPVLVMNHQHHFGGDEHNENHTPSTTNVKAKQSTLKDSSVNGVDERIVLSSSTKEALKTRK